MLNLGACGVKRPVLKHPAHRNSMVEVVGKKGKNMFDSETRRFTGVYVSDICKHKKFPGGDSMLSKHLPFATIREFIPELSDKDLLELQQSLSQQT